MAELTTPDPARAPHDIREVVREKYAAAARASADADDAANGCGCGCAPGVFGSTLYDGAETRKVRRPRRCRPRSGAASRPRWPTCTRARRCSTSGSGAGADVLISARRVGASGRAIGLDMTDEMLELARANAAQADVDNVEFVKGYIEDIPLPDASVDVVISNCVINLAADKPKVLAEAARVLRPGGRFAVSDVIADPDMDAATRADVAASHRLHRGRPDRARVPRGAERRGADRRRDPRDPPGSRPRPRRRSCAPASPPAEASAQWPPRSSSAARTPGARRCPRRSSSRPPAGATARCRPAPRPPTASIRRSWRSCASSASTSPTACRAD